MTIAAATALSGQQRPTYAERLGWKASDRVLILHMDDAGMSYDSDAGIQRVLEHGAARSLSVMMPCPWVPAAMRYVKAHPETDAGLHLTLTSEWRDYRWPPLAGPAAVPGLVDSEGAFWNSVEALAAHASAAEVDREIRAQLERAERAGFHPTHLDSHMGALFATAAFLERYVRLGIEKQIPVMIPAGHCTKLKSELDAESIAQLKKERRYTPGMELPSDAALAMARGVGDQLWRAGLPVLDDLHNESYGWPLPAGIEVDDGRLGAWRTARYIETLKDLKPGVTMVIMHCTAPTEEFAHITDSGALRKADMLAMLDPKFEAFLKEQGFIVSTWRELSARRKRVP
ncbi:MAG TPA: polysaccharide deacetylase family protein [Bryobacteraceae bacterium]